MPTIADLLLVEVQVNTGNSATSVENVNKQLQGTDDAAKKASSSTDSLTKALGFQNVSAVQLATSFLGVNVGLAAVSAIGQQTSAVIADLASTSIRFGGTMAEVAAISSATGNQMLRLSALARTGGVDIGIGGNEAARGLAELTKGGVSVEASLHGALRASELMAKAGGVDLAQAAEISAVAMNSFGLSAQQLPHVADLVAGAANASSIGVEDFRQSLTQAGAVARTVGVSFDDTSVAIAELGQAGIKGSDAGTSLRTFLLRLTPESKEAENAMRSLGIVTADGGNKFFDASGRAKSLSDISQVLRESLAGYSDQQRIATLQTIFGTDAVRAASVFAREGAVGFNQLQQAIAKVGADDVARQRLNSLAGDMDVLASSAERLKLAIGGAAAGPARPLVQGATGVTTAVATGVESGTLGAQLNRVGQEIFRGSPLTLPITVALQASAAQSARDEMRATIARNRELQTAQLVEAAADVQSQAQAAATAVNVALKPARDLRAELDALATSGKGAAAGLNVLETATAGLRLASQQDIGAVAALRAEIAVRLREQAAGERASAFQFRARLATETTDPGATAQDRAIAQQRLTLFDQEFEAQQRMVQIEQQRATVNRTVQREEDQAKQASLQFEHSQLPLVNAQLDAKIAGIQIDQQAAPLRSALLVIEQQLADVGDKRLGLERERATILERQRSFGQRNALEDNQTRIRELQLELESRDPNVDRAATRREIRNLQRAQPGLELEVLRSDSTLRAIDRQQSATKLGDDLQRNSLEQQRVALQAQLSPLERRKQLVDQAAAAVQRLQELDRAQFDQGQIGARGQLMRDEMLQAALGMSASDQQAVIDQLGKPLAAEGPQPIAGQAGGNNAFAVTVQFMGDTYVRSDEDLAKMQDGVQAAVLDAVSSVFEHAANNATAPASTDLSGARRPLGQPRG
jgi:TP901 family phage tail tape measure protein